MWTQCSVENGQLRNVCPCICSVYRFRSREMIWHIFYQSKTENVSKKEQTLTQAGNLYRIHNREFSGTTSNWSFRLSYDLLYKDASKQQKQPAHANLKSPLKYLKLLKRTNNIGPTTGPWGTPYAVVRRMELCLQSIDFEVGRWCMGTFIVPY